MNAEGSLSIMSSSRAGARWLGPHPSLDVGAASIQYIAFDT